MVRATFSAPPKPVSASTIAGIVIALAMYYTAFQGGGNFGVGSAIAVFLFLLVIPVLALNVRRFKRDV